MRVKDRLRAFAFKYNLTHEEMAAKLETPYPTFAKWMRSKDNQPPGCMMTLMNILERSAEARKIVGIKEEGAA
jgi:DNA-binding transcriptional regulator YiaG